MPAIGKALLIIGRGLGHGFLAKERKLDWGREMTKLHKWATGGIVS